MKYQCLNASAGCETTPWFIECDVSIGSNSWELKNASERDTAQKQFYSTNFANLLFVPGAFLFQVLCVTVEDMNILGIYIDMGKEMLVHERMVRLLMIPQVRTMVSSAYLGKSTYSSILKVMTCLKDSSPFL